MNDENSLAWLVGIGLLMLLTAAGLHRLGLIRPASGSRHAPIDGLRGFLAASVFLHHGSVWFTYARTGHWYRPSSPLLDFLGGGAVGLFFMITAFLFVGKLLDTREGAVHWGRLYLSRLLRLAPLYAAVVLAMLLLVGHQSGWQRREPWPALMADVASWVAFCAGGLPDLNGLRETRAIVAGATWTLAYEWLFYASLPLLAVLMRRDVRGAVHAAHPAHPALWLLSAAFVLAAIFGFQPTQLWVALSCFSAGGAAAWFVRTPASRRLRVTSPVASCVVVGCIGLSAASFTDDGLPLSLLCLSAAFILIAAGNDVFGLLTLASSRALGEVTYSVYLLHGLVLYATFSYLIPAPQLLSTTAHWSVVAALAPVLVGLSAVTFRFVERPAMERVAAAHQRLRAWLGPLRSAAP